MTKFSIKQPLIFWALCLVITGALCACGPTQAELEATEAQIVVSIYQTQTAQAPTHTPTPMLTPTPTVQPAEEIFKNFVRALEAAGTYHFEAEVSFLEEENLPEFDMPLHISGKNIYPNKSHFLWTLKSRGITEFMEQVVIDDKVYTQNFVTKKWIEDTQPFVSFDVETFADLEANSWPCLTVLGIESLNGIEVFHLEGVFSYETCGDQNADLTVGYWIRVDDYLPVKATVDGEMPNTANEVTGSSPDTLSVSMTMSFSNFGAPVTIEKPQLNEGITLLESTNSGDILFEDDFSDPTSGWHLIRTAELVKEYVDGKYHMAILKEGSAIWSYPGKLFSDVSIEVVATKIGGPDYNQFGVICRREDLNNFYFMVITSTGHFGIGYLEEGTGTELFGGGHLNFSEAINQGGTPNLIRADCVGSTLTLHANDIFLMEVIDNRFTSGDVGLIGCKCDATEAEVFYDDFIVRQP